MPKNQRIRDPLHDLISFESDHFSQLLWSLLNCKEFQRLRRIKQLGFSELVYPGATHSRFAHSVGVYHTARILIEKVRGQIENFDLEKSKETLTAALVHDLGHGPFSHAFEEAIKQVNRDEATRTESEVVKLKKHEIWTSDILLGDTEIGSALHDFDPDLRASVAKMLTVDTPADIYAAVVSSQFDADRLDYLRRDRLMTGVNHGVFDFSWLIANLEVGQISLATDDEEYATIDSLVLSNKSVQAAESYVLGLFQMYFTVYFHKATRSAEKMLTAILRRLGQLCAEGKVELSGLRETNPIIMFIRDRSLSAYLALDDYVIWGALSSMRTSEDVTLANLTGRLLDRNLYKCIDVSDHLASNGQAAIADFRARLSESIKEGVFEENEIFQDQPKRDPYKRRGHGSPEALSKIFIRSSDGRGLLDLSDQSPAVKALETKTIYRVYVRDDAAREKVQNILGGMS